MKIVLIKASNEWAVISATELSTNPTLYDDWSENCGAWILRALPLCDGIIVKKECRRIVDALNGADIDAKFNSLPDEDKPHVGREIIYDLQPTTLIGPVMTQDEYDDALEYRKIQSIGSRAKRYVKMMECLGVPSVFAQSGKFAFLVEELRKYKDDYTAADNKIFEAFIAGTDHEYSAIPGYPRAVDFATTPTLSLNGLTLWDDVNLGGPDADYKTLVTDIINNTIMLGKFYEQA